MLNKVIVGRLVLVLFIYLVIYLPFFIINLKECLEK